MRDLIDLIEDYARRRPEEGDVAARFLEFARSGEELRGKGNPARHVTASAWVVNVDRSRTLLTHHRKLGIWVQLGGHTELGEAWRDAALREAREESGLAAFRFLEDGLFDLDIHPIPGKGDAPSHFHYDLRFLLEADDRLPLSVSEESRDLRWVSLTELPDYSREDSLFRMAKKTPRR
jgi:8-oxo-dGTP pyrophosphatase MutT (NUDIX family)